MSRDMAQRTIIVKVERPEYSATWEEETRGLIDNRRWEIIGDCLALLKERGVQLSQFSRWGEIKGVRTLYDVGKKSVGILYGP
jgi:hypothetical protein